MPNWCENGLTITGDKAEIDRFLQDAPGETPAYESAGQDAIQSEFSLAKLYPAPVGADLEDWYVEHWGTKWDVNVVDSHRDTDNEAFFQFDTAWTPPLSGLRHISALYPSLKFSLTYEESGEAFMGVYEVQDGNVLREEEREMADDELEDEDDEDEDDE